MEQAVVICTFHGCKRRSDGGSQGYSDLHHFKPQPSARLDPTTTPTVQAIALPTQPAPSYLPDYGPAATPTRFSHRTVSTSRRHTTACELSKLPSALCESSSCLEHGLSFTALAGSPSSTRCSPRDKIQHWNWSTSFAQGNVQCVFDHRGSGARVEVKVRDKSQDPRPISAMVELAVMESIRSSQGGHQVLSIARNTDEIMMTWPLLYVRRYRSSSQCEYGDDDKDKLRVLRSRGERVTIEATFDQSMETSNLLNKLRRRPEGRSRTHRRPRTDHISSLSQASKNSRLGKE